MAGFIAVILNMGIIQLGNLKDYWSTVTGTVMSSMKGLPKDVICKQKEPSGSVHAARSDDMTVLILD